MMSLIAKTPIPPYYAEIFTSVRPEVDYYYGVMAENMATIASQQEGFLAMETAREGVEITVSYREVFIRGLLWIVLKFERL